MTFSVNNTLTEKYIVGILCTTLTRSIPLLKVSAHTFFKLLFKNILLLQTIIIIISLMDKNVKRTDRYMLQIMI